MAAYTEEAREQALVRLMQLYGDSIKRMCCIYLKDPVSAEDAAQETFIKAYSHIDQLLCGDIQNEKAWLTKVAINTCKDSLRSAWLRHMDRRKSIEELPFAVPAGHEDKLMLAEAIMNLPQKYKDIVLLHFYQGLNLRTCAQILGISAPTATRRLAQATKCLRLYYEGG